MGKMKTNYNIIKPTKRQQKKSIKEETERNNINVMTSYLEQKWNNKLNYTCNHCLLKAYNSVINDETGYVTDEELIISSNNTLKHL